jgi:type I restriction enzyme S subunit
MLLMDKNMRELQELPAGWRRSTIGEVIANAQSGFACGIRDEKGVIQLRMNNVSTNGGFVWEEFIRVPRDDESVARYKLLPGDIVFNNTNSTELVGKSALFQGFSEDVVYSNHFTRLRVQTDKCDPAHFSYWLNYLWKSRVFENICNRWIGQSAIKPEKLFSLKIPLPPLSEQRRIAAILTKQLAAVEQARKAVEAQLATINDLPSALLRQAFTGAV